MDDDTRQEDLNDNRIYELEQQLREALNLLASTDDINYRPDIRDFLAKHAVR